MIYYLCGACVPKTDAEIFGYEHRKGKRTYRCIHCWNSECTKQIPNDQVIPLDWNSIKNEFVTFVYNIRAVDDVNDLPSLFYTTVDKAGIVSQITKVLAQLSVNIVQGEISGRGHSKKQIILIVKNSKKECIDKALQDLEIISINSRIQYCKTSVQSKYLKIDIDMESEESENNAKKYQANPLKVNIFAEDKIGLFAAVTECIYKNFRLNLVGGLMTTSDTHANIELWIEDFLNSNSDQFEDEFECFSSCLSMLKPSFDIISVGVVPKDHSQPLLSN